MKQITGLGKIVPAKLISTGYEVLKTASPLTYLAQNTTTGDMFYFSVRWHHKAVLRTKTNNLEFGIDIPEYNQYKTHMEIPFVVFFETLEPFEVRWIMREEIERTGRIWKDPIHFPGGNIFILVSQTQVWVPGMPFKKRTVTDERQKTLGAF